MDMTLEGYVLNPMGKNNAVMSAINRETQRKIYKNKFDHVLLRENGHITYNLYKDDKKNTYWAHIKVPSESVDKFYYDVVFKFYTDAKHGTSQDLFKWYVKFFSNDPAFMYTYAYVFNEKELTIPELKSKYSKKSIKDAAKEKNPDNLVGYVKIIYFAYLVMEMKNLNKIKKFEQEAQPLAPKKILSEVVPTDEIVEERQSKKVSKKKKVTIDEKTFRRLDRKYHIAGSGADFNVTTTKRVKKISNTNSIKSTPKVKRK